MKLRPWVALSALIALCVSTAAGAAGFHGTFTVDGIDVWAVGDAGTIYRSLNSGTNWTSYTLGDEALRAVTANGLTAIVVSDSGKIWRSATSGQNWAITVVSGAPNLYAAAMPSANVAYVAGAAGKILKSVNGGANWSTQTSGTPFALRALKFVDDDHGWAVGDGSTVLRTSNGGTTWSPVSVPAFRRLLDVDQYGSLIWIVGEDGTAVKSTNDGGNWSAVNLKLDDQSDVRVVHLANAFTVFLAGGGGFIRVSGDGGDTWDFKQSTLHGRVTDATFFGDDTWITNADNRVVFYSLNDAATWSMPSGATLTRGWTQKLGPVGTVRGSTLQNGPQNKHAFYAMLSGIVMKSLDDGETWNAIANYPNITKTNAFIISPKDSMKWLAAVDSSGTDWIARTTNGGATWTKALLGDAGNGAPTNFGNYGIPLEMNPDKPDTVFFGGEDATGGTNPPDNTPLWRTTDFGLTWAPWSTQKFRSPCDIIITPDNNNVVLVGDGITSAGTGLLWRSTDGGVTFGVVLDMTVPSADNSEIPGMSVSRLLNTRYFAAGWGGPGQCYRSTNGGASYSVVNSQVSGWGNDVCKEDPNVVMFGVYSGNHRYISYNGGDSWNDVLTPGSANYSFYARDRACILTEDSDSIRKMDFNYTYSPSAESQSLTLNAPNGGEVWPAGTVHNITWSAAGIAAARIEYRANSTDPWTVVADVPGYQQIYAWTVPAVSTTTAKVRVRDLWDNAPTDSSNAVFSITSSPMVELLEPNGGEVWQFGSAQEIAWNSISVPQFDLEYRTSDIEPWALIALGVSSGAGAYSWSIPDAPSTNVRVRITASGGGVTDLSSNPFSIIVPRLALAEDPVWMGGGLPGAQLSAVMHISNPGTAALVIPTITQDHPKFWLGRSSLTVPPSGNDTLGIWYQGTGEAADTAHVTFNGNDPTSPRAVNAIAYIVPSLAAGDRLPTSFAMWQNQPNPFAGATTLRYALPVAADVSLEVFDVQGHRVATLARGARGPGEYAVSFGRGASDADGARMSALGAGVYFARFRAGTFEATRKMLMMR